MRFRTTCMAFVDVPGDQIPEGLQIRLVGTWLGEVRLAEKVYRVERDDLDSRGRVELWKLGIPWSGEVEIELGRRSVSVVAEEREGATA